MFHCRWLSIESLVAVWNNVSILQFVRTHIHSICAHNSINLSFHQLKFYNFIFHSIIDRNRIGHKFTGDEVKQTTKFIAKSWPFNVCNQLKTFNLCRHFRNHQEGSNKQNARLEMYVIEKMVMKAYYGTQKDKQNTIWRKSFFNVKVTRPLLTHTPFH